MFSSSFEWVVVQVGEHSSAHPFQGEARLHAADSQGPIMSKTAIRAMSEVEACCEAFMWEAALALSTSYCLKLSPDSAGLHCACHISRQSRLRDLHCNNMVSIDPLLLFYATQRWPWPCGSPAPSGQNPFLCSA
jgi:hypothetical protein